MLVGDFWGHVNGWIGGCGCGYVSVWNAFTSWGIPGSSPCGWWWRWWLYTTWASSWWCRWELRTNSAPRQTCSLHTEHLHNKNVFYSHREPVQYKRVLIALSTCTIQTCFIHTETLYSINVFSSHRDLVQYNCVLFILRLWLWSLQPCIRFKVWKFINSRKSPRRPFNQIQNSTILSQTHTAKTNQIHTCVTSSSISNFFLTNSTFNL